jgi:hypothetical protein
MRYVGEINITKHRNIAHFIPITAAMARNSSTSISMSAHVARWGVRQGGTEPLPVVWATGAMPDTTPAHSGAILGVSYMNNIIRF